MYVSTITLLLKVIIRLHVPTIDSSSSGLFCQMCHKMLSTLRDPIVFTSMEYIKLNRLSLRAWCANCVYKSGIHKIGSFLFFCNTFYEKNDPNLCIPLLWIQFARHALRDKRFNLMYSMDVNTMGSQSVHSILWHLFLSFRRVLNVIYSFLGNSPASEF